MIPSNLVKMDKMACEPGRPTHILDDMRHDQGYGPLSVTVVEDEPAARDVLVRAALSWNYFCQATGGPGRAGAVVPFHLNFAAATVEKAEAAGPGGGLIVLDKPDRKSVV